MLPHRFVAPEDAEYELAGGRGHYWHCRPGFTSTEDLLVVKVRIEPGGGHSFHCHPNKEEVLYFLSGTAEQWVEQESRILGAGSSVYVPKGAVHATFNAGDEPLDFIAVITPVTAEGPIAVELGDEEPWRSIRNPG